MKRILILLALLAPALALAQTVVATPPTYPITPVITVNKPVGATIVWNWVAPTTNTDGSAITGALTYTIYESYGGAFMQLATGITGLSYSQANLTVGTECIYVTVTEAGANTVPSQPSNMPCALIGTAPIAIQPNPPTKVSGY